MSNLTRKEKLLLSRAMPKNGVVYLEGRPGECKSALIKSIATKTQRRFFDIRLSQMDETDVGLFPDVDKEMKCLNYVVPRWAVEANKQPSIILFDELNRAQLPIRNAALQILLDRRIGWEFEFNSGVLFFAAGNIGDLDGCDVEEFDAALWGRLIHVKHEMLLEEWIEGFAKENVWEVIVSYLRAFPQELYKRNDNTKVYASHRSWTFLSDYIKCTVGGFENADPMKVKPLLEEVGMDYIGSSITKFLRFLEDLSILNINDVINRFDQVENQLKKFNRAKLTDLLTALKEFEFKNFNETQYINIGKFIKILDKDEAASYFIHILDKDDVETIKPIFDAFPEFKNILKSNYEIPIK